MQVRRFYESKNKQVRAAMHRKNAVECEKAGYREIAKFNWQMANLLDPLPEPEEKY